MFNHHHNDHRSFFNNVLVNVEIIYYTASAIRKFHNLSVLTLAECIRVEYLSVHLQDPKLLLPQKCPNYNLFLLPFQNTPCKIHALCANIKCEMQSHGFGMKATLSSIFNLKWKRVCESLPVVKRELPQR